MDRKEAIEIVKGFLEENEGECDGCPLRWIAKKTGQLRISYVKDPLNCNICAIAIPKLRVFSKIRFQCPCVCYFVKRIYEKEDYEKAVKFALSQMNGDGWNLIK